MATHSSILAREIPWTEESMGQYSVSSLLPGIHQILDNIAGQRSR